MLKFTLQPKKLGIADATKKIEQQLDKVPYKAHEFFKYGAPTPIRTGNARRNTRLEGNEIVADYPYAEKLNEGSSKQAPKGMTEPTLDYIHRMVDRIMKGGSA